MVAILIPSIIVGVTTGSNTEAQKGTAAAPTVAASTATLTAKPTPAPTAKPTLVPTAKPTAAPTLPPTTAAQGQAAIVGAYEATATKVTVSQLGNSPSTYNGTTVTFDAVIYNFLQDSSGSTTAMNVYDPSDPTSFAYIQLSPFADVTQMNKGDTITIWGDGAGDVTTQNAYGGTIHETAVTETYLADTTTGYADNSDPNPS